VGRTGRAEATGEAYTFVAPEDEASLRAIERAVGKPLPRVVLSDFDYRQRPEEMKPAPHQRPAHPTKPKPRPGSRHDRRPPDAAWASRIEDATRPQPRGAQHPHSRDARGQRRQRPGSRFGRRPR
jgi:ATP-dependent RNA helicase RhlE